MSDSLLPVRVHPVQLQYQIGDWPRQTHGRSTSREHTSCAASPLPAGQQEERAGGTRTSAPVSEPGKDATNNMAQKRR